VQFNALSALMAANLTMVQQGLDVLNRGRREGGGLIRRFRKMLGQQTEDALTFYVHDCSELQLCITL